MEHRPLTPGPPTAARDRPPDEDRRERWREARLRMEADARRGKQRGRRFRGELLGFDQLAALFGLGLRMAGLHRRGLRNAHEIGLTSLELAFESLPPRFDGFRILQLSDLHADFLPGTVETAGALAAGEEVDLCVLTGDFKKHVFGPFEQVLPALEGLRARLRTRLGVYAVLGNHDCADMVAPFEALGIEVLLNETRTLERGGEKIHITGTDDVHLYRTEAAGAALRDAPAGFKIALIHSAEFADVAADAGYHLYLAGHTHGGQICLPGGRPIVTQMRRHRRYAVGLWRHGAMQGYTTTGVGVSTLPVRFNSRGEVVLLTLRRKKG